ncbi:hypothetical protein BS78_04G064600 [Paspalum vaginatum]|nr:hypothetical protein BS78_04G064600 [Paspalum vaginatum]
MPSCPEAWRCGGDLAQHIGGAVRQEPRRRWRPTPRAPRPPPTRAPCQQDDVHAGQSKRTGTAASSQRGGSDAEAAWLGRILVAAAAAQGPHTAPSSWCGGGPARPHSRAGGAKAPRGGGVWSSRDPPEQRCLHAWEVGGVFSSFPRSTILTIETLNDFFLDGGSTCRSSLQSTLFA